MPIAASLFWRMFFPAMAGYILGGTFIISLPIWVAAFINHFELSDSFAGYAGSIEVCSVSLAMLLTGPKLISLDRRKAAIIGAVVAIVFNLLSAAIDNMVLILIFRTFVGFGLGVVLTCGLSVAAGMHEKQRAFAFMEAGIALFATCFFMVSSASTVLSHGLAGIFFLLAAVQLLLLPTLFLLPPKIDRNIIETQNGTPSVISLSVWGAVLANGVFYSAIFSFWTYISLIGQKIKLENETISYILSFSYGASLLMTLLVPLILRRYGYKGPIVWAVMMMAGACVVLTNSNTLIFYAAAAVILKAHFLLYTPTINVIFAKIDPTGRINSYGLTSAIFGSMLGPAIGGIFLEFGGYTELGLFAAFLFLLSLPVLAIQAKKTN